MPVQRLKELRARDDLTQDDLATLLGGSPGTVGMWETGKRGPDREMLIKIADLFKVSLDYLVGRKTPENPIDLLEGEDREKALEYARLLLYKKTIPEDARDGLSGLTESDKSGNSLKFKRGRRKRA